MKSKCWLLVVMGISLLYAKDTNQTTNKQIAEKEHVFSGYFGGQTNYSRLDIDAQSAHKCIFGANLGVSYRANRFLFSGNFIWNQGNFTSEGIKHHLQDAFGTLNAGYLFIFHKVRMGPYVGLGLRRWNDQRYNSSLPGYDYRYLNYFIPFGMQLFWQVNRGFQVGLITSIMPSFDSTVQIEGEEDVKWILGRKTSFSVELPLTWRMVQSDKWKNVEIVFVPFWRWLKTGESAVLQLADRNQTYIGIALRLQKRSG